MNGTICGTTRGPLSSSSLSSALYAPETYAALNRVIPVVSNFRYPLPGCDGSSYASGTPRTTRLSIAENVRRPIRYDRCVSRPRSLPSSSRCDASRRWTPSDRPSRPIMTNSSANSGLADSSSENSSRTRKSVGIGGICAPRSRAAS